MSAPGLGNQWIGMVMSCERNQTASDDGRFADALASLLRDGPSTPALQTRWDTSATEVRADELITALTEEWADPSQKPQFVERGTPRPMVPNPRYVPVRVPEPLTRAARGSVSDREGWPFTDWWRVLNELVAWLRAGQTGTFVVTGPPGAGKSALLGRLACLSDPRERAHIEARGDLDAGSPDPGQGSVSAAVHAGGHSASSLLAELERQLGAPASTVMESSGALAEYIRHLRQPPVIILDALDEMPNDERTRVIEDLLLKLDRIALLGCVKDLGQVLVVFWSGRCLGLVVGKGFDRGPVAQM